MDSKFSSFFLMPYLLCLWITLSASFPVSAENTRTILILAKGNDGAYAEVIKGFKSSLSGVDKLNFETLIQPTDGELTEKVAQLKPVSMLALGSGMTQLAEKNTQGVPIISTLVLTDSEFNAGRSSGVSLTHSFKSQIDWLKKFFPEQHHIAVFFNPQENSKTIQQLQKVTDQAGLSLVSIPVQSPRELPGALEQLAHNVEVLLAIPDEVALAPNTIKEVMLASFRNRVPFVGLSENWVKSGALYALSWDYEDLGRQCGEQTQKLLKGQSIENIAPEKPRIVSYAINLKIAEHLNISLGENLIRNAKKTFN